MATTVLCAAMCRLKVMGCFPFFLCPTVPTTLNIPIQGYKYVYDMISHIIALFIVTNEVTFLNRKEYQTPEYPLKGKTGKCEGGIYSNKNKALHSY